MKERRYLKKMGEPKLRLFGWTPELANMKNMVECDAQGKTIITAETIENTGGLKPLQIFQLGMSFHTVGEKTIKGWIEKNAVEINAADVQVQGLIVTKWQKCFGSQKMPDVCKFMVSGNAETGEPEMPDDTSHPVDMEA